MFVARSYNHGLDCELFAEDQGLSRHAVQSVPKDDRRAYHLLPHTSSIHTTAGRTHPNSRYLKGKGCGHRTGVPLRTM